MPGVKGVGVFGLPWERRMLRNSIYPMNERTPEPSKRLQETWKPKISLCLEGPTPKQRHLLLPRDEEEP